MDKIEFITCLYSTEGGSDFRGQVLEYMLAHSRAEKMQVVAGENSPYPNGPANFFEKFDFARIRELGRVVLNEGVEDLVLLSKDL